jgi:large subunit ribosomal protein L21
MTYAIISLGGKQYRVQEGQRLLVDRVAEAEGKTFHPTVLFVGGNGKSEFSPKGTQVTAKVVGSALGDKIRIGKYKKRTGYRRHTGHRAQLTQIEITAIGASRAQSKPETQAKPAARAKAETETGEKAPAKAKAAATTKPKAPAKPKTTADAKPKAAPKPQSKSDAQAGEPAAPAEAEPKEETE